MAWTVDQASIGTPQASNTSATTITLTTNVAIAAGSWIFLSIGNWDNLASTWTVADNGPGLTWTVVRERANSQTRTALVKAYAPAGMASGTVITATFSTTDVAPAETGYRGIAGAAFKGGGSGSVTDASADAIGSTTAHSVAPVAGAAGALIIETAHLNNSAGSSTPDANTTELVDWNLPTGPQTYLLQYRLAPAAGATTVGGTWSSANAWAAVGAAFSDAGGGGGVTGTAAQTLPVLSQAATGTRTVPAFTGSSAQTLAALSQSVAGTRTVPAFTATAAQGLPAATQAAAGTTGAPAFTGTSAQALPALSQAAAGATTAPAFTATAGQTLPALSQSAAGTTTAPSSTGTSAQTLPALTQTAAGATAPPPGGSAIQTLPSLTQTATGTSVAPTFTATAAQSLPAISQTTTGTTQPPPAATAAQQLPALTQTATGAHAPPIFTAIAAQTLPAMTQSAVYTTVGQRWPMTPEARWPALSGLPRWPPSTDTRWI